MELERDSTPTSTLTSGSQFHAHIPGCGQREDMTRQATEPHQPAELMHGKDSVSPGRSQLFLAADNGMHFIELHARPPAIGPQVAACLVW